jgi:hypothetical protein
MKRSMGGGAHRGPVAIQRQRRTLRFVQGLLVVIAAGLLMVAGYQWGRADGYEFGRADSELEGSPPPSAMQVIALGVLGGAALSAALALQGKGGIRIPTPARLEELAGRAEKVAIERAEAAAAEKPAD